MVTNSLDYPVCLVCSKGHESNLFMESMKKWGIDKKKIKNSKHHNSSNKNIDELLKG